MNKFLKYGCFFLIIFLNSCGSGPAKDVMDKEKMQAVLWDVAKGGEFVNGYVYYRYPNLNRAAVNQEVLKKIFDLHGISKKQFDKSLEYYQKRPETFVAMLDSIAAQQNRIKAGPIPVPPGGETAAPQSVSQPPPVAPPTPVN